MCCYWWTEAKKEKRQKWIVATNKVTNMSEVTVIKLTGYKKGIDQLSINDCGRIFLMLMGRRRCWTMSPVEIFLNSFGEEKTFTLIDIQEINRFPEKSYFLLFSYNFRFAPCYWNKSDADSFMGITEETSFSICLSKFSEGKGHCHYW